MNEQVKTELYEILDNMSRALENLQHEENAEVKHKLSLDRGKITKILEGILKCSLDEQIDAASMSDVDWVQTIPQLIGQIDDPFRLNNIYDAEFQELLEYIWGHSKQELVTIMIQNLNKKRTNPMFSYIAQCLRKKKMPLLGECFKKLCQSERPSWLLRLRLAEFLSASPFWGTFNPRKGDYNTFELRAAVLKQHSYDFLWLYRRLNDYLSKRTLCAILSNWAYLDIHCLRNVKSVFPDYWEPDIFPDNKGDVLVDCGAYTGDSIMQYVQMYGDKYHKVYAYEIAQESYTKLCENMSSAKLHDIISRYKGTGKTRGELFVDSQDSYSGNHLCQSGSSGNRVEVVTLDEDVEDTITFLKMDIEGAEFDTLLGCKNTIHKHHPKLAICIYHGYNDIWKIPLLINTIYPNYHFYLRYNGEELFPTEFVLLCKE